MSFEGTLRHHKAGDFTSPSGSKIDYSGSMSKDKWISQKLLFSLLHFSLFQAILNFRISF